LWALVGTEHFELRKTAYPLSVERAMKENLMFLLCGELFLELAGEFQFIIEGSVAEPLPPTEELLPPDTYTIKITDAGFVTKHGRIAEPENELFWLFMCCAETNHIERPTQQTIKAIHHPEPGTIFPLSRILLTQLAWNKPEDEGIDWNAELQRRPFPSRANTYRQLLHNAIERGIIRYVLQQQPHTMPEFLRNATTIRS
jgi:hypothetical protein